MKKFGYHLYGGLDGDIYICTVSYTLFWGRMLRIAKAFLGWAEHHANRTATRTRMGDPK